MIEVYCTSKTNNEMRLSRIAEGQFSTTIPEREAPSILVDTRKEFQEIEGFGGAFTEAAAVTLRKLPPARQAEVLAAYFDPINGHGYNLCRTHINSCDFSLGNYAYAETPDDFELQHFSIERDRQALIPMIKTAQSIAGTSLRLFASPWSPPAWMKTTGQMNRGGKLRPECRDVWARYYVRYVREMEREGIPIWGLTVQNEVEATQSWDSCVYSPEEERDFVRDYLGPTLHRAGLQSLRLMIYDHNRDHILEHAMVVYDDPEAAKYIWGTAFHWYSGDDFENLRWLAELYPEKKLIFTEGCQEKGPHLNDWHPGERYAFNMIHDLNCGAVAWTDWNLLLDETGGPNHVGNFCSAPIIADTRNGRLLYQSSYFYMGHFTRFICRGARRIVCATTTECLPATAFRNPNGSLVAVILNRGDQAKPFALKYRGQSHQRIIPAHSILTLRWTEAN